MIVEGKCGFSDVRHAPATKNSRKCNMRAPLAQVADCALHRHFAQLLVTREMLARDKEVKDKLKDLGIETDLSAVLLYLDDDNAEIFELPEWWVRRGAKLLKVGVTGEARSEYCEPGRVAMAVGCSRPRRVVRTFVCYNKPSTAAASSLHEPTRASASS